MRYLLNGSIYINLWDRIGGRKPNPRPLSEPEPEQSECFYTADSGSIVDGTSSLPDVVDPAEEQAHIRHTAHACQYSTY